jgi:hypothetical protein
VIQGYARGLAAGVENITWFALSTLNHSDEQGLLYPDWTPKPAYYTYQTLTTELAGYEYSHERSVWVIDDDSPPGFAYTLEAYVFENACHEEKTVAWAGETGTATLTFAPAGQLRVVDRQGNATSVVDGGVGDVDGTQNGAVELQLSADPVFVRVTAR